MFEGVPTYPDAGRFWKMIQDHKVSVFYTAPTAIRSLIKANEGQPATHPTKYNLSGLRILGTVGEPINPEAWMWYHTNVGGGRCPIVDTWWQTETGGHLISPLPGVTPTVPGSCTLPLPGIMQVCVPSTPAQVFHMYYKMINPNASTQKRVTISKILLLVVALVAAYVTSLKPGDILFLVGAAFSLAAALSTADGLLLTIANALSHDMSGLCSTSPGIEADGSVITQMWRPTVNGGRRRRTGVRCAGRSGSLIAHPAKAPLQCAVWCP